MAQFVKELPDGTAGIKNLLVRHGNAHYIVSSLCAKGFNDVYVYPATKAGERKAFGDIQTPVRFKILAAVADRYERGSMVRRELAHQLVAAA